MKEIKAYVRTSRIDPIARALRGAGFPGMSVIHVRELGKSIDPTESKLSIELAARCADVVKLELVCTEDRLEEAVTIIQQTGRTGRPGDGIIYVSTVDTAIKIRTSERGIKVLN